MRIYDMYTCSICRIYYKKPCSCIKCKHYKEQTNKQKNLEGSCFASVIFPHPNKPVGIPVYMNTFKTHEHKARFFPYLLLFLSLTCPPGSSICPFFSQVSWGSGSPWAWQVKMAVVPTGRAMDCGG